MGRSFFSKGGGIYMSYVYRAESSLCQAISVTTAAAVAVATALEGACDGEFGIKWVNDIICDGKKVCGILTESLIGVDGSTYVIVGIGINVGECRFPKEIENIAGSVDIKTSPEELISEIIQRLRHYVDSGFEAYMQGYRDRFILSGKHVTAIMDGECICGTVVGVDDDGALLLVPNGAISAVRIFSGEVSVRF